VEAFIPDADKYQAVLQDKAQGLAAAQAAKDAAMKEGKAGVGEVARKKGTVPVSPKLTRPRPPRFQEPIQIEQKVSCHVLHSVYIYQAHFNQRSIRWKCMRFLLVSTGHL
jgi:hypothetical protein